MPGAGSKAAAPPRRPGTPAPRAGAQASTSAPTPQATAAQCYDLKSEYLRFGCPFVSSHSTYYHPGCVAIRARMRNGGCQPIPGETPIDGLGMTSIGAWIAGQPAPVAFGAAFGLALVVGTAASVLAAKALGRR